MNELKVHVERIVRPVRAAEHRKCRMREELLAHMTAAFNQEREAGCDDATAIQRSVDRFGDPEAVRKDLQASVPFFERIFWVPVPFTAGVDRIGERFLAMKPGEKPWHNAARVAIWVAVYLGSLDALCIVPMLLMRFGIFGHPGPALVPALKFAVGAHGGAVICTFFFVLCSHALHRSLERCRHMPGKVAIVAAATIAAAAITAVGLAWAAWWARPLIAYTGTPVLKSIAFAFVIMTPPSFLFVSFWSDYDRKRRETWGKIKI